MATKSDEAALHSSIALLQERFKQLQKIREMREEKELLRTLSHDQASQRSSRTPPSTSTPPSTITHCQPPAADHHRPSSQLLALSLWPESRIVKHPNFVGFRQSSAQDDDHTKSWLCGRSTSPAMLNKLDDSGSDVDTSLHL